MKEMKLLEEQLKELVSTLDKNLIKFAYQAKLNNLGNAWIYQQIKIKIEEKPKEVQPLLIQWLDNRWGEYKLF